MLLGPEDEEEEASLSRSSSSLSLEDRSCEEKLSTEEEAFLFALLSLLEWNFARYTPVALLASFLKSYAGINVLGHYLSLEVVEYGVVELILVLLLLLPLGKTLPCFLLVKEVSLDPSMHLGVDTPVLVDLSQP